jgi:hypothetical protein
MILAMLGWPVEKSRVDAWYLSTMAVYKGWEAQRERLAG